MHAYFGEYLGTLLLIMLGEGVVAGVLLKNSKAEGAGWIVITVGWGLAITMAIFGVGSISGAHLNPAVTLSLAAIGTFPWADVPGYIVAQMLGGFSGAVLVYLYYYPHWAATDNPDLKLAVFCTAPAMRHTPSNLFGEIVATFILVFGVLVIGAGKWADGFGPLAVGMLLISIGMSLGGTTGYAMNPARDLAPRIAHAILPIAGKGNSGWDYAWVPTVGPIIGGIVGAIVYQIMFG